MNFQNVNSTHDNPHIFSLSSTVSLFIFWISMAWRELLLPAGCTKFIIRLFAHLLHLIPCLLSSAYSPSDIFVNAVFPVAVQVFSRSALVLDPKCNKRANLGSRRWEYALDVFFAYTSHAGDLEQLLVSFFYLGSSLSHDYGARWTGIPRGCGA